MMRDHTSLRCPAVDREAQLLLAGARTVVDEPLLASACRPASGPIDWERVESLAAFHGVSQLLHASLGRSAPDLVPPRVLRRFRERARANVHHSLFLCSELVRLVRRFEASNIPAVPFKGPVLAAYAYGDTTAREYTDLDVFVPKERIVDAARVVLSQGYVCSDQDAVDAIERAVDGDGEVAYTQAAHYTFYRPDGRSRVDLQWRMAEQYFAFALGRRDPWQCRFSHVFIGACRIPTFSPTDTLLVLCAHGSKHRWEKLKWLCDIAELLRAHGAEIDWDELARAAAKQRARRMLGLGLALARELLDAPIPPEVVTATASDAAVRVLTRELRGALFATPAPSPTKLEQATFYLRLKDRWQDRARFVVRYAWQWSRSAMAPTAADQALLPLPRSLAFAQYLVRPLRLSVKFTISGLRWLGQKAGASAGG